MHARRGHAVADRPTAPAPAPGCPVPRPPSTPLRLALALSRAESSRLSVDLWFGAGLGFLVLIVVLFGWIWAPDDVSSAWRTVILDLPVIAHPMAGMAVVAAHRAVTRGRRDGAEELFGTCPLAPTTRTAGHLLTAWLPAAAVAVLCGSYLVVVAVRAHAVFGSVDSAALGDMAAAPALAAGGVALGVALGRWAPWGPVPFVAVFALFFPIGGLGEVGEPHWSNLRQLSTWPRYPQHDVIFTVRPVWWHLVWLLALGALVAVLAAARHTTRRTASMALAAALVAAVAGVGQTRPTSGTDAARLASMVAEPERHQSCVAAGRVSVCSYGGYDEYAQEMLGEVGPVMAAAPAGVAAVRHRQVFDGDLAALGPEVGRALHGRPAGNAGALPLGFQLFEDDRKAARLRTAFAVVGLPVEPHAGDLPEVVAGQARGVLALWLAARGLDHPAAQQIATAFVPWSHDVPENAPSPNALARGMAWPDPCGVGPPPVAWSEQDLAAARSMLDLPEDRVVGVVRGQWATFTDPRTSTDDLLGALGLPPVGAQSSVVAEPPSCGP